MICAGVLAVAIIFFTSETRGSVILSRRAKKLRKQTGDQRYACRSDAERASLAVLIRVSMTRPLCTSFATVVVFFEGEKKTDLATERPDLLGTEAIVFFFSVHSLSLSSLR